jgi:AmmeMemoRadiSam system protein B
VRRVFEGVDIVDKPKMRPIEAIQVTDRGRQLVMLRDPQGFSEQVLTVPQPVFYLITQFDGNHTLNEVQANYTRRFGQLIFSDKIKEILEVLDNALMLDSDRFRQHREALEQEFRGLGVRPCSHGGKSYPGEAAGLSRLLDSFFEPPTGPGQPTSGASERPVKGLMAPHIDLQRGGPCFAHAYKELAESPPPDTVVLLGIAHTFTQNHFVLTRKSFETPFGVCECDTELTNGLLARGGLHLLTDELAHRTEHSIEFQVVFLQHLFASPKIVSVLCGAFRDADGRPCPPDRAPGVPEFIAALRETLQATGKRVCLVASVDFSHLGGRFGDRIQMTPQFLGRVEREDLDTLGKVASLDADAFYADATTDNDRRHIDATPAVYTLLKALDLEEAKVLKYDQSVEAQTQSVVTFASMVFR